ncbi:hypothetical protein J3Q64DRAFT_1829729 [Phycomyces blakesleeanus]|uniref:Uncharacterized protein n=1 Tax=Phycomyces blakesleeanus TaxID=4837 RepID=A0ABR3B8X5_PHYBL
MPTSPVPHIMAHSWTKPPKESTVWYLSPEIGQSARLAQSVERETLNLKAIFCLSELTLVTKIGIYNVVPDLGWSSFYYSKVKRSNPLGIGEYM